MRDDDRDLFGKLVRGRIVRYDRRAGLGRVDSKLLAQQLAGSEGAALAIQDDTLAAAIALSPQSSLQLHHMGGKLAQLPYRPSHVDCKIATDCDAIVPDTDWRAPHDDAGLAKRRYGAWERELVVALVHALLGERPAGLIAPAGIVLDMPIGHAICSALMRTEPKQLLGEQLLNRLRAARILRVHGQATAKQHRRGRGAVRDLDPLPRHAGRFLKI